MKLKNLPTVKKYKKGPGQGRYQDSNNWTTGPCPIRRDKYYGWLKHRAQARYRNEYYDLEFEQFESLWKDKKIVMAAKETALKAITNSDDNYCYFTYCLKKDG